MEFNSGKRNSHRGAAIIIVLAFIVLLTGIVLALFVRSLNNLKLSESNAEQIKADLFARGAAMIIQGDLKQEIVDGSGTPSTFADGSKLYVPSSPAKAVPQRTGTNDALPNLVKRSASAVAFYTGGASRSSAVSSSDNPSLNGRSFSTARWNKAYLLPKKNVGDSSDATPIDGVSGFTAPNWIYVARDGSNPTSWNDNYKFRGSNPVLGRYAFCIYDEGGLLDANVAGYPTGTNGSTDAQIGSKATLSYADLSLIFTTAGFSQSDADDIANQIVGWRNYATLSPSGTFPVFDFGNGAGDTYFSYVLGHLKGFMSVGNKALVNGQSDRFFSSRQELMKFLLQGVGKDSTERAKLQVALQYLATFTRGLEQPSFVPTQSVDSTHLGFDSTSPKVLALTAGGNLAQGLDSLVNPPFLGVRVKKTVTGGRNDGSDLTLGEPLVKKRFALNRLAWLTYEGPSASASSGTQNSLLSKGIPQDLIDQGTVENIKKYFGLTWSGGIWSYNVHNRDGALGPICKLDYSVDSSDVVRANREADFFELLKASIKVGSIAKPGTVASSVSNTAANLFPPVAEQYGKDSDVDGAIVQIAANIIDQFDSDGYITRINFNNGSGNQEYRGVENLPYLSRVLNGFLRPVAPNPASYNDTSAVGTGIVTNTGLGVLIQTPELWNPHDWDGGSAAALDRTLGTAGPTKFRLYAESDPLVVSTIRDCSAASTLDSPGYKSLYGFDWSGEQITLSQTNTEITFDVPKNATGAQLFREPTFLFRPGKPTGTNLAATPFLTPNKLGKIGNQSSLFTGGGITSAVGGEVHPILNTPYVGIYLGTFPLVWKEAAGAATAIYRADMARLKSSAIITYYLQYQDAGGNWVTYDKKSMEWADPFVGGAAVAGTMGRPMREANKGFLTSRWEYDRYAMVLDPRTSRFNFINTAAYSNQFYDAPPFNALVNPNNGWIPSTTAGDGNAGAKGEGITVTLRDGKDIGTAIQADLFFQKNMGFYPGNWAWNNGAAAFRPGLFSQNVNLTTKGNTPLGDGEGYPYVGPVGQMTTPQCYADPDGVVRRAMGGYVTYPWTASGTADPKELLGLPLRTAHTYGPSGLAKKIENGYTLTDSRPMILNRPFRSVAELGYTFSGTPWKNINFSMPESGDSALLDVFCLNETEEQPEALVAGKINLNTWQKVALQAIITGAYRDEMKMDSASPSVLDVTLASAITDKLLTRTKTTPLANVAELVGKWKTGSPKTVNSASAYDGKTVYDGFSADLQSLSGANVEDSNINRFRNASMRALTSAGQTRVWNLMIDLVAQTGRFSAGGSGLENFVVEGEQRLWVHVSIDRLTGKIVDQQIEVVKE